MNTDRGNSERGLSRLIARLASPKKVLTAAFLQSLVSTSALAASPGELGATASATIQISVSVARRFGVAARPSSSAEAGRTSLCIDTNGAATPLPVTLVFSSSAHEQATLLLPCTEASQSLSATDPFDVQAILVRPE